MNEGQPVFETQLKRIVSHSQRNEIDIKETMGFNGKAVSSDEYSKKTIGELQ